MISIPRSSLDSADIPASKACIVGIGNAGVALVDALTLAGASDHTRLIAVNTDSVSLGASVVSEKLLIGQQSTRGLGSGGDPELGAQAAEEAEAEIASAIDGTGLVILCGGLGGGTASGALPVIAEIAGRINAVVIAMVTLPFSFEGKRRTRQAEDALHDLTRAANAVITFENDKMSDLAQPMAGLHETFAASDQVLADSLAALLRLIAGTGPMRVNLADILTLFRPGSDTARFGTAVAQGGNRANQVMERVMKSPLLKGRLLSDVQHIILHIEASSSLRFVEVETAACALAAHAGSDAQIHLALTTNDELAENMVVSVLAAGTDHVAGTQVESHEKTFRSHGVEESEPENAVEVEKDDAAPVTAAAAPKNDHRTADELFNTEPFSVPKDGSRKSNKPKQETLSLDSVARGRFEKSEPTIVGGEDLDVPTFLRQKIKLR